MQPAHARKAANALGWLQNLERVERREPPDKKIPGQKAGDEFTETNTVVFVGILCTPWLPTADSRIQFFTVCRILIGPVMSTRVSRLSVSRVMISRMRRCYPRQGGCTVRTLPVIGIASGIEAVR